MLKRVVPFPELTQTQAAAYHVFSGSESTFLLVVNSEEAKGRRLQIRLFQESGSLLRPIGEPRLLEQILSGEKDVSQVLQIPIQLPEVQAVTSFVCVLQTLEPETGKTTTLHPPFRIKAYPPKESCFTQIESVVKAILNQTESKAVQIFGPMDSPLISLVKSCDILTDDLGERSPDRWEPGIIYFGEVAEEASTLPPIKGLLRVVLDTDPDTGSRFIQVDHGQTQIRLYVSSEFFSLEKDPEFLHLFIRSLQQVNLPRD